MSVRRPSPAVIALMLALCVICLSVPRATGLQQLTLVSPQPAAITESLQVSAPRWLHVGAAARVYIHEMTVKRGLRGVSVRVIERPAGGSERAPRLRTTLVFSGRAAGVSECAGAFDWALERYPHRLVHLGALRVPAA